MDVLISQTAADLPQDALDFCSRLADVAALQYSRHLSQFAQDYDTKQAVTSSSASGSPTTSTPPDFSTLCDVFCAALRQRFLESETGDGDAIPPPHNASSATRGATLSRPATACGGLVQSTNPATVSPPSRRRVSRSTSPPAERRHGGGGAKQLRRSITKRMPSFLRGPKRHDSTSSTSGSRGNGPTSTSSSSSLLRKQKPMKKEGVLQQLVDVEGSEIQWAKCRVVLKKETSGHIISFYSPPKVSA